MTDLEKTFKKKPMLLVWLFFGVGILFFIHGTLFPIDEPMINTTVLIGEVFFGIGIITGAVILIQRRKR
jgi:hypothetical protein